jgi:CDGSH-type Zn-finger protein
MARLVRHDMTGPYRIDPADFPKDGKAMWICGCGLSSTMPYCDKSHKACKEEQAGTLYVYDPATKAVVDQRPDPQPPAASDPAI